MSVSYKNAFAAPSLESPPNLSATKIESQSDSHTIVPCLVGTPLRNLIVIRYFLVISVLYYILYAEEKALLKVLPLIIYLFK
jgi:hypothetical protein